MEKALKEYKFWRSQPLPEDLSRELAEIELDKREIYNRFCKDIAFGTSGLRGRMGAGSNRINSVVLKRASRAVSAYLSEKHSNPRLVIGYDTRINSKEYAAIIAEEFSRCGVNICLFQEPTPVPVVSFAIRHLGINGGIMITASHNTGEYNGYKVYDHFGNQIDDEKARLIEKYIEKTPVFSTSNNKEIEARGKVTAVPSEVKEAYLKEIFSRTLWWDEENKCRQALKNLKAAYTPLNGAGLEYVAAAAENLGMGNFTLVETQTAVDGTFQTCPSPNPENREAFIEALRFCRDLRPDMILATDPDSDRMGIMVLHEGDYRHLSGNQVGELMLEYICRYKERKPGERPVAIKSLVSSPLTEDICRAYGVEMKNVLTGFKNISLKVERLKDSGRQGDFLFGFEESLGYLYGDYTRDKDGVMASQLICIIGAYCKSKGMTLVDMLEEIYMKYGYQSTETYSKYFENEEEWEQIDKIMGAFFRRGLKEICGEEIFHDFSFKSHNLYRGTLKAGHSFIIRPSGTEFKLKAYVIARGTAAEESSKKAAEIMTEIKCFITKVIENDV